MYYPVMNDEPSIHDAFARSGSSSTTMLIVACEESGDNYGALLARELLAARPGLKLVGLGGPRMASAGVELLENMVEHSATGLSEVLASLSFFVGAMNRAVSVAAERGAKLAVLIDSPDFNLRIAPRLRAAGVTVAYYVSPQLWAWRASRIKHVRRDVDRMFPIFPFEERWYAERDVDARFFGHPILDLIDLVEVRRRGTALRRELAPGGEMLVGLLPGSRRNEITRLLPRFLEAARLMVKRRSDLRFVVGCAEWLSQERLEPFVRAEGAVSGGCDAAPPRITALRGRTHEVMAACDYLLCCSGTATLEAALIGTPLLMAYRLSWPTWALGQLFISSNQFFCMPNILLQKEAVPELIQFRANPMTLALTALEGLRPERLAAQRAAFSRLEGLLGGPGASRRVAAELLALV